MSLDAYCERKLGNPERKVQFNPAMDLRSGFKAWLDAVAAESAKDLGG
jgi:hypothetical protein